MESPMITAELREVARAIYALLRRFGTVDKVLIVQLLEDLINEEY